jgi:DNA repair protein RadC
VNVVWATTELRVRKEMPPATVADLPDILTSEGMYDATQEVFWVAAYDATTSLRAVVEAARGDYYRVAVSIPVVMNAVLVSGANRFYVGHNHPSAVIEPTEKDLKLTNQISLAAAICGIFLEDHWVLGPGGRIWSMRDRGQFTPSPAITELYAANGPFVTHDKEVPRGDRTHRR